jgi:hypothetical protein
MGGGGWTAVNPLIVVTHKEELWLSERPQRHRGMEERLNRHIVIPDF